MKEETDYYKKQTKKLEEDSKTMKNLKNRISQLETEMKRLEISKDEKIKSEISEKNKIKEKYEQLKNDIKIKNKNIDNNKLTNNSNNKGIKCDLCLMNPIIGIRYKCTECSNLNLCEKCFVNNNMEKTHKHKFILIKEDEENIPNININDINNNETNKETNKGDDNLDFLDESVDQNPLYGSKNDDYYKEITEKIDYETKDDLEKDFNNESIIYEHADENEDSKYIYQTDKTIYIKRFLQNSTSKITFDISIKNIGKNKWSDDTKLYCDKQSDLRCPEIKIKPLKPNASDNVLCIFEGIEQIAVGKYTINLNFIVDEIIYGKPIKIFLLCEEDKELKKVNEFRKEYALSKKDYTDETLKKILKDHNWDFQQTFDYIFQ